MAGRCSASKGSKLPVNWINNVVRPKIRSLWSAKRDVPENLWVKCPETGEMVFHRDLEANQWVIPNSGYHMRMPPKERFVQLFDGGDYEAISTPAVTQDPLKFRDEKRYVDRLRDSRAKTGNDDAVLVGAGRVEGNAVVAAVQDFDFMGGSLGTAAGEAIIRGIEEAVARSAAFVMFTASGGARMQEGILSLMQMPRTTVAVEMLREAGLPYIVVLTNPDARRRHCLLCHAGRRSHRRAGRADRLCRSSRHRADHSARSCRKASSVPNIFTSTA